MERAEGDGTEMRCTETSRTESDCTERTPEAGAYGDDIGMRGGGGVLLDNTEAGRTKRLYGD